MSSRVRIGALLCVIAFVLLGCSTANQTTHVTVDGATFPNTDAALTQIRLIHTNELAQISPVAARVGGTLLVALPSLERIQAAIAATPLGINPTIGKFVAESTSEGLDQSAQAVDRARIFDAVTITRSAVPEQAAAPANANYRLWVVLSPGGAVKWFLSRGGGPAKPIDFPAMPPNTGPKGVQRLNLFNALVTNAAADLGAAVARQPLPGIGPSSGTGFFINATGAMLTNNHVIDGCRTLKVILSDGAALDATPAGADRANDLAVIQVAGRHGPFAQFRSAPARQGEDIVVFGFPLAGVLSSHGNITTGIVSALTGLKDDSRLLQISAPIQPGDSGGPVFDTSGNVAAIATGKLNALGIAQVTHDIAQNVNFAIKADIAQSFLSANGISFSVAASKMPVHTEDISDRARSFTNMIQCQH